MSFLQSRIFFEYFRIDKFEKNVKLVDWGLSYEFCTVVQNNVLMIPSFSFIWIIQGGQNLLDTFWVWKDNQPITTLKHENSCTG